MREGAACFIAVVALLAGSVAGAGDVKTHARHLIYLHGRIVQDQQSGRPRHPRFGYYELEQIKEVLQGRGFDVSAEIRPRSASVIDSADGVVAQVRRLLGSGVPADHVTVVGASMGAAIALLASTRLQSPDVRFCVLGCCLYASARELLVEEGRGPSGRLLAIREASDESTGRCPAWRSDLPLHSTLLVREIVLRTGLSHGFLYRPLPEWVDPVVAWASAAGPDVERPEGGSEPLGHAARSR